VVYAGPPGELDADGVRAMLAGAASRSGLVLVSAAIGNYDVVARVARAFPRTRFVVGDYQVQTPPFSGLANVTGITYSDREAGYLAGYLAALVAGGGAVSVVGG